MKSMLLFSLFAFSGVVFAGEDEFQSAKGVGYALVIVEKCTGISPPPNYVQRVRAGMTNAGIDDEDFRQGFVAGAVQAERDYRGKPPANECKDAKRIKAQIDKLIL
ncbi:MAG: hypothetical protein WCZ98_04045 [Sideroxydans sp.]